MNLVIKPNGDLQWIGELPIDIPFKTIRRRRVSTIQPVNRLKRFAFLLARRCFGEQGRVAAFTRRWSGPWRCVILATGQTETFQHRADAIRWELETIKL